MSLGSLEEIIGKMNNLYEKSKHKVESKKGWKQNNNTKGKWPPKREKPLDSSEKENVSPYKKFNAVEKEHGPQLGEQHNRDDGMGQFHYWICGNDYCK